MHFTQPEIIFSDQERETGPSSVVPPGKGNANPDVLTEELVGPAVLPSKDKNDTVVPNNEEGNATDLTTVNIISPADLTSEEDASPEVPPDEQTLNTTLTFSWDEVVKEFSDKGDSS